MGRGLRACAAAAGFVILSAGVLRAEVLPEDVIIEELLIPVWIPPLPDVPVDPEPECPACPEIITISVNGVKTDIHHPLHDWVRENIPGPAVPYDPFDGGFWEFCSANPSLAGNYLSTLIADIKQDNPCAKIMVVGHSMGGVATHYAQGSDCKVMLDPPACDRMGTITCESMRDTCRAYDQGMDEHPGYVDLDKHDPFHDPERHCDDMQRVSDAVDQCIAQLRPGCDPPPPPPPGCNPDPTPTPLPTPNPNPGGDCSGREIWDVCEAEVVEQAAEHSEL